MTAMDVERTGRDTHTLTGMSGQLGYQNKEAQITTHAGRV